MTVATTGGGPVSSVVGLEDVAASDIRIPRLKILHKEGKFFDPLTGTEFPVLNCVIFGIVKQRVMWDSTVDEGDVPQCKSADHNIGFPNISDEVVGRLRFPWKDSNFDRAEFPEDENGRIKLPCERCKFAKWGTDNTPPRCSEVLVMPMLYTTDPDEGSWTTALLSVTKTGLKPTNRYMSSFVQKKEPMFGNYTEITLEQGSRGTVTFSVPKYKLGERTPVEDREEYGRQYLSIREFLRREPRTSNEDEGPTETSDNTNTPAKAAPAASKPADPPAETPRTAEPTPTPTETAPVASVEDDDDLPF